MRFWWLYLRAVVRGLAYRWPSQPPIPRGYSGVSCALSGPREAREMYHRHGWEPWGVQRIPRRSGGGYSRTFRIRLTPEEIELERLNEQSYREAAEAYERDLARGWNPPPGN